MDTTQVRTAGRFIVDAPSVWTDAECDVCSFAGYRAGIFERSDGVIRCEQCEVARLRMAEIWTGPFYDRIQLAHWRKNQRTKGA